MGTQTTGGGTVTSFNNTPQAGDDLYWRDEETFGISYFDVLYNDLGGKAKILWSLDDGGSITDLLAQDGARAESTSTDTSANGARIWITSTGQVGYDHDTLSAAFQDHLQSLAVGETATDTFRYTIRLANGTLSWATATVVYGGVNDAPVISLQTDDSASAAILETNAGLIASGSLTVRDIDTSDIVDTAVSSVTAAGNTGTLTNAELLAMLSLAGADDLAADTGDATGNLTWAFDSDGTTFDYLAAGELLTISYVLTSSDGNGGSDTRVVTIIITGTNDAAIITGATSGSVIEDADPNIVSGNLDSTDVDGTADSFTVVSSPAATVSGYGTYTVDAAGNWAYTLDNADPDVDALALGEQLSDSFIVEAADGTPQTITITITGANDAPDIRVETDDSVGGTIAETNTGLSVSGTLTVTDVDTSDLVDSEVSGLVVSGNSGTLLEADLLAMLSLTGDENLAADTGDSNNLWWSFNSASEAFNYLAVGQSLTLAYTITSTDNHGVSDTQTVTITITGTNDVATIAGDGDGDVVEDVTLTATGQLTIDDEDSGEGELQPVAAGTLGANSYGTFEVLADGSWTYTLDNDHGDVQALPAGETLTDTIEVTSEDGTDTHVITVTITGTNGPATIAGDGDGDVAEDVTLTATGQLTIDDEDSGEGELQPVAAGTLGANSYGTFEVLADGSWTYTLDNDHGDVQALPAGETLTDTIEVTSEDGTDTHVITVTITGTNGPATIAGDGDGDVAEDVTLTATGQLTIDDEDSGEGELQPVAAGTLGANSYGTFEILADGSWTYTLDNDHGDVQALPAGETLTDTIEVTSEDGTDTHVITVTITGTNDIPVAQPASNSVVEHMSVSGNVGATDADDGAVLTYALVGAAPIGLTFNADGSYSFSAASYDYLAVGEPLVLTIPFTASDGVATSDAADLTITITGTNDNPDIRIGLGDSAGMSLAETNAALITSGTLTVTDIDLLDMVDTNVSSVAVAGNAGSLTNAQLLGMLNVAGASGLAANVGDLNNVGWTFNSGAEAFNYLGAGQSLTLTYTLTSTDGQTGSDTQTVTITINGTNDAAVITGATSGSVTEATAADAGGPTATGTLLAADVDNAPNTFVAQSSTATASGYGSYTMSAAGVWTYTLNNANAAVNALAAGAFLLDSFTVQSADGTVQMISVTINGANDVIVVAAPATFTGGGDENDYDLMVGGAVNNTGNISGSGGNDTITGGAGDQTISGNNGNDTIFGGGGVDNINGNNGDDFLYGQVGNDKIDGNGGLDTLYGGSGADELTGSNENDTLFGGSGNDTLNGSNGNDLLIGGYGADTLTGGGGADTFKFLDLKDTNDIITDFLVGTDFIDLSALDADPSTALNDAFGWNGSTPGAYKLWFADSGSDTVIYGDTDGDATTAEFMITLQGTDFTPYGDPLDLPPNFFL